MVGRLCYSFIVLNMLLECVVLCYKDSKSSLTFVIDETISMQSDIRGVIKSVNKIFDSVYNSKDSPIGIFKIVSYDENVTRLLTETDDREQFLKSLNELRPHGGGDCPEITLSGIELGLRKSNKDSYVLVFTDAPAKDTDLYEKVKNFALDLNVKIIFLLTNSPCLNDGMKNYELFNDLADATGGQVFQLSKGKLPEIMNYIKRLVESRKIELGKANFPPGYGHKYNCSIDSGISNVTVVVTGRFPKIQVENSSLDNVITTPIADDKRNTIVIDLQILKPGDLYLELGSKNETKMTLLGTTNSATNIDFGYGFSVIKPSSLNGTTIRPIPDYKSHVVIKVNSNGEKVNVTKIEIVHLNGSVIMEYPMHIIDSKEQFYVSEPINIPNCTFKIKINGVKESTSESLIRISNPVEVQKIVGSVDNKAPLVNIMEKLNIELNYGDSLQLQCIVSGYPTPNITWKDKSGSALNYTILPKKLPYDYISILKINRCTRSTTFSCKASNELGSETKSVDVEIKPFFKAVNISKDKVIEFNKADTLYCKVEGYPPVSIIWRLNGKQIEKDDDINVSSDRYSLNIKHMKPNFAGNVTCEVKNTFTTKIYAMKISVTGGGKAPLVNITGESKIQLNYGEPLQLQCVVTGHPKPNITWEDESGTPLKSMAMSKKIDDYISTLAIDRITQSNTFSCKATNNLGSKVKSVEVFLNPFIEVVDISKDKVIEYNEEGVLYCKVKASPPANITWRLNGKEIDKEKDMSVSFDRRSLIIKHMKPKFSGNFTCEVKNNFITKIYPIKLTITGVGGPKINKEITEMFVPIFNSVYISCRIIKGNPRPTIQWFYKNEEDKEFNEIEEYNEIFHIKNATANRAGTYKCVAKNEIDSDTHTVHLSIEQPVTIDVPEETTFSVMVGKKLELPCPIIGYPTPPIKWRFYSNDKRDKEIDSNDTLQILRIQTNEAGYYTCYAETNRGPINLTYTVNVLSPPSIKSTVKNLKAIVGDLLLKIQCLVTGNPKPHISWFKNGERLTIGSEWYSKDEIENLLIKNVDTFHAGVYFCNAENDFGTAQERFTVTIQEYPVYETIKAHFEVYIDMGKPNEVKCPLPHTSTDLVRWYKGKEIKQQGTLTIQNCGKYTCRVSNFSMSASIKLVCKRGLKPRFSKLEVMLGPRSFNDENRRLGCDSSGKPRPMVNWIFNGKKVQTANNLFSYTYEPTLSSIGQYECVIENAFGKINRIFNITGRDCALSIEKDFDRYHPLIVTSYDSINKAEVLDGHVIIPNSTHVTMYCPGGFNMFADTKIDATCVENKTFRLNEKIMEYPKLKCVKEFTPTTIKTGQKCGTTDTELILIGISINENFVEVYKICFEITLNIPLYVEHNITNFYAGVPLRNEQNWFNSDIINYDVTEMFDCKEQKKNIAKTFEIITDDDCCYALRQLVNEKDVQPGFSQITTYSYLNVIPHWSSMTNWNALEDLLRKHAKWCQEKCLEIVTGISQPLLLPVGDSNVTVHIKDKSNRKMIVPVFLWKVIKDLNSETSVAVIHLNIPKSLKRYIPKQHPCTDICNKIKWMSSIDTTDENKGLMYCCYTLEFERIFQFKERFTKKKYRNLLNNLIV